MDRVASEMISVCLGGLEGSLLTLEVEDSGRLLRVLIRESGLKYQIPLETDVEDVMGDSGTILRFRCAKKTFIHSLKKLTTTTPQVSVSVVPDQVLLLSASPNPEVLMQFYLPLVDF